MSDNIVGVVAILCIFGLPISAWIVFRAFQFIERMEMIKRGIVPPPDANFGFGRGKAYRDWAQQQARANVPPPQPPPWQQQAPPPWQQARTQAPWSADDDAQRALHKGIRLALIGLALTLGFGIAFGGYHGNPVILGGLIPMFVGIAQIIIALLSGAQLPGLMPRATLIPPPPPPGPPPGYAAPPPPSGAWEQPGRPHFEELSKPVQPPDLR